MPVLSIEDKGTINLRNICYTVILDRKYKQAVYIWIYKEAKSSKFSICYLDFHINKKSVDLSEDGVIHLLQIFQVTPDLVQATVNFHHLVTHVHLVRECLLLVFIFVMRLLHTLAKALLSVHSRCKFCHAKQYICTMQLC